jgi:hypothetical protein
MRTAVHRNRLAIVASAIVAVAAACHVSAAHAQAVVPPQTESFPLTYGEWGARWWQYVLGIPVLPAPDQNPLFDTTGARCGVGQWGPVFFLVGTVTNDAVARSCDIPADMGLFFPIINIFCAVTEDGDNAPAIGDLCGGITDHVDLKSLSLTIDGKRVQNLDKFRASEFFSFTGAAPGVFATTGCTNSNFPHCYEGFRNTAFADGYWAMLRPLSLGKHTVHFHGENPFFPQTVDVTYNLNVAPQ